MEELLCSKNLILTTLTSFVARNRCINTGAIKKLVYTEGVRYLAKEANCYWLLDEISLSIFSRLMKQHQDVFYSIDFVANADQTASIIVGDGNHNIYLEHKIEWTDFPVKEKLLRLYLCESGSYYCLMLTSEY